MTKMFYLFFSSFNENVSIEWLEHVFQSSNDLKLVVNKY